MIKKSKSFNLYRKVEYCQESNMINFEEKNKGTPLFFIEKSQENRIS